VEALRETDHHCNGDTHLGGDDYDRRVVDWMAEEFKRD
jgi:molecular chaperone DnaK (HSP70)